MGYKNLGIRIKCPICGNYGTLVVKVRKGKYRQAYVVHWPDKQHYVSKFTLLNMGIDIDKVPIDEKQDN
ncbi:hypothetical protein [Caldivirga sp. MU80]|uniref:hypothetical protein n=1 Tax=Caldivirga sp. MU80 TaxID=1650354 RepID=UPI000836AF9A|nr:hypothetical protein [Caldivirga sp. MU80]